MASNSPYYVYVYRDPQSDDIRYVGKGTYRPTAGTQRVEHHLSSAHNAEFRHWIERLASKKQVPAVELFPCASEEQAFTVEAALISALWTTRVNSPKRGLFNKVHGHRARFVPIGLPEELADRRFQRPLTRQDVAEAGGALVVYISSKDFQTEFDDRRGAAPHYDLTDDDVRQRILGWWQIGRLVDQWRQKPSTSPALMVGITGTSVRRWVWGALRISRAEWASPEQDAGGLYRIAAEDKPVDARRLRGRLVRPGEFGPLGEEGNRHFGAIASQFFDVVAAHECNESQSPQPDPTDRLQAD
jgi:hypothetical protein